jgi:hypothetical protein
MLSIRFSSSGVICEGGKKVSAGTGSPTSSNISSIPPGVKRHGRCADLSVLLVNLCIRPLKGIFTYEPGSIAASKKIL